MHFILFLAPFWHPNSIFRYSFHLFQDEKRASRFLGKPHKIQLFRDTIKDYSMIVATLPEPTVLPPSRYRTAIFFSLSCAFPCFQYSISLFFHLVFIVLKNFVIMPLSRYILGRQTEIFCCLIIKQSAINVPITKYFPASDCSINFPTQPDYH